MIMTPLKIYIYICLRNHHYITEELRIMLIRAHVYTISKKKKKNRNKIKNNKIKR